MVLKNIKILHKSKNINKLRVVFHINLHNIQFLLNFIISLWQTGHLQIFRVAKQDKQIPLTW